jgi:hypothetical protein
MDFIPADNFVQDRIQTFHKEADAYRREKAARRAAPAHRQSQVVTTFVRLAQVALTLGR